LAKQTPEDEATQFDHCIAPLGFMQNMSRHAAKPPAIALGLAAPR